MKRFSVFVLVVLFPTACIETRQYEFRDLIGVYGVRVCPDCYYEEGWEIGISDSIQLTLLRDSSYEEIHLSYGAFEFLSYWGKWKVRNDSVILTPIGELDWSDGSYYRIPPGSRGIDTSGCNALRLLLVNNPTELLAVSECRMAGAELRR